MSTYYTAPPTVVDGDVAYAADVNDLNVAAGAAFDLVEGAITDLPDTVEYWANKAEDWAEKAEDSQVESGKYSAKHHAAKAQASATSASGSANTAVASSGVAVASASTSSTQAGIATTQASTATIQAGIATTQAGIATTKATLATDYAQKAEDSQVESGTYSAYHWSKKSEAFATDSVLSVTGTGVNNTDPRNPVISLDKTSVGLANVDNTSDANKPVSTAQQTALNLKANLISPIFTGTPAAPTAAVGTSTTQVATTEFVERGKVEAIASVEVEGSIFGGDIEYAGSTITVQPFSTLSTGGVRLSKATTTTISTAGTSASAIIYVFAVKLVADGSITCYKYTDPDTVETDSTVSAYKLLGIGFMSDTGVLARADQIGDTVHLHCGVNPRTIAASITTAFADYDITGGTDVLRYLKSLEILVTNTAAGYISVNYDTYLNNIIPYTTTAIRNKFIHRPNRYINCKYTTANCGLILAGYTFRR